MGITIMYSLYTSLAFFIFLGTAQAFTVDDLPDTPQDGSLWVFLVVGSNGWYNYRHQADVCHAYQIVHDHGVPDDHIIVMMYDDIAYNIENPTPGKIINHPNGSDVYHGVPKDYVCGSVRPDIFLQVLKGEKVDGAFGSGKTLNSGPKDNIFVYFADHGAKGLVAFGESTLKAVALNKAIQDMYAAKKYNKMVFYVEACESGSMFKGLLPKDVNVFATTASNATTSSYACYFDKQRKTFLGDVYSIKWLEDSDKENIEKETLEEQYRIVKRETNTSMVSQFGDMDISKLPVGTFQGPKPTISLPRPTHPPHYPPSWFSCGADAVPGPEVPVKILHDVIDVITNDVGLTNTIFTENVELTQFDCYYAAVDAFHDRCFNVGKNDYGLRMLNTFVNLCERKFDINDITEAIQAVCTHPHMYGIH